MSKLDPGLETELSLWRAQAITKDESAALGNLARVVKTSPSSEKKQIVVGLTQRRDIEELQSVGLQADFDRNGMVAGSVAFEDLEQLAPINSVIYIENILEVRPVLDETASELQVLKFYRTEAMK